MSFDSYYSYALNVNEFIKVLEMPRTPTPVDKVNTFVSKNPHFISNETFHYYIFFEENDFAVLSEVYKNYFRKASPESIRAMIDFIEALHKNPSNIALLNKMVFYVDPAHRVLSLSSILLDFRSELMHKVIPESLSDLNFELIKSYILGFTLKRAHNFQSITSYAVMTIYEKQNETDFEHLSRIKALFDSLPNVDGFVLKEKLVIALRNDEFLSQFMHAYIRNSSKSNKETARNLIDETLQDLLDRVESESEAGIDWGEFRQYFTRRGFPM